MAPTSPPDASFWDSDTRQTRETASWLQFLGDEDHDEETRPAAVDWSVAQGVVEEAEELPPPAPDAPMVTEVPPPAPAEAVGVGFAEVTPETAPAADGMAWLDTAGLDDLLPER